MTPSYSRGIALTLFALVSLATAIPNTIYILRNAETPSLGLEGLSPVGQERANSCLPEVFGPSSAHDIGLVMACLPAANTTECHAAVDTASPLAAALSLTLDTSCATIESNLTSEMCVVDRISTFGQSSQQNVLIVWDVEHLDDLLDEFDLVNDGPDFPEANADVYFTIRNNHFVSQASQSCPGIDGSVGNAPAYGIGASESSPQGWAAAGLFGNETTTEVASLISGEASETVSIEIPEASETPVTSESSTPPQETATATFALEPSSSVILQKKRMMKRKHAMLRRVL